MGTIYNVGAIIYLCIHLSSAAIIDLTYPFDENTVYWIKDKFDLEPMERQIVPFWMAANKFKAAEHGGTHIDAPYHFNRHGWKLGEIPLNRLFMVEGVLINKTEEVRRNPEYQLTVKDIQDWERENGKLPPDCVVLVQFGWACRYPNRIRYLGIRSSDDFDRHFPTLSEDAARYLMETGKVLGIGTDTASPDNKDPSVHRIVTSYNAYILENLKLVNLEGVPPRGFKLVILPFLIEQGTGAPVHVVLVTDDEEKTHSAKWY